MQTIEAKCEAIISLLQCVYAHLDYMPGAAQVQHYGDSDDGATGAVAPPLVAIRRWTCWQSWPQYRLVVQLPPKMSEEKWAREYEQLRRQYRIGDVEESLTRLSRYVPRKDEVGDQEGPDGRDMAQAVWAVHVEPWLDPRTEPIAPLARKERDELAKAGIAWMAHDIHGDVLALGDRADPRDNQIRQLAAQGYARRRIAREVRCSLRDVQRALSAYESAVGG